MAGSAGVRLISNGSASSALVDWPGGLSVFAVAGTFGGATVSLGMLAPDGVTVMPAGAATTLTANGTGVAYLPPCQVMATVAGGAPSGLYATLARVVN